MWSWVGAGCCSLAWQGSPRVGGPALCPVPACLAGLPSALLCEDPLSGHSRGSHTFSFPTENRAARSTRGNRKGFRWVLGCRPRRGSHFVRKSSHPLALLAASDLPYSAFSLPGQDSWTLPAEWGHGSHGHPDCVGDKSKDALLHSGFWEVAALGHGLCVQC